MRFIWLGVAVALMSTGCAEERGFIEESSDADVESADITSEGEDTTPEPDAEADGGEKDVAVSCLDEDGDGYGVDCEAGEDCDDANELIFESLVGYADADGDGYTIGQQQVICAGETLPAGYALESLGEDCDDSQATVWREVDLFVDADGDEYASGEVTECIGEETPEGRSLVSTGDDCDDADPDGFRLGVFYVDGDGDGFTIGDSEELCVGENTPDGYSTESVGADCDDSDSQKFSVWVLFTDADNDGYGSGENYELCSGATLPEGTTTASIGEDCDDNNASLQIEVFGFADEDGDDFGAGPSVALCTGNDGDLPDGFVTNDGDCDDGNPDTWTLTKAYVDSDQDGFGAELEEDVCAGVDSLPAGYTLEGGDCDDGNENLFQLQAYYPDNDEDGVASDTAALEEVCSGTGVPPKYASVTGDCDDGNPVVQEFVSLYVDSDGDGFGAGELLEFCDSPEILAVGYASLDGDCAPDDETAWFLLTLYPDTDQDGFGDESEPNELCLGASLPEGLVSGEDGFDCAPEDALHWFDCGVCVDADGDGFGSNCDVAEDCNDMDEDAYPGAEEIPDNGQVEDCNGPDLIANSQEAVFVAANAPSGGDGSKFSPLQSLTAGMQKANSEDKMIVVAFGTYEVSELVIESSLHGGYNSETWERDSLGVTTIQGLGGFSLVVPQQAKVRISGVTLTGGADILSYTFTNGGELRMDDSIILQDSTGASAVVTGMLNTGVARLRNVDISAGAAQGTSNGIENKPSGVLTLTDSSVVSPVSNSGTGTGIRNEGWVRVENSQVEVPYTAGNGNGVLNISGTLEIAGGLVAAANSGGSSAAVTMEGGTGFFVGTLMHGGSGNNGARGLSMENGTEATILQSILRTGPAVSSEAIELTGGSLTVVNSILETHEGTGTAVRCTGDSESLTLLHNLLYGGEQSFIAGDYSPENIGVVTEESIELCSFGCCEEMAGNLIGDPLYLVTGNEDPDSWDFHVDASSPVVGAGMDVTPYLEIGFLLFLDGVLDLDGEAHPGSDGLWDIGLDSVQ